MGTTRHDEAWPASVARNAQHQRQSRRGVCPSSTGAENRATSDFVCVRVAGERGWGWRAQGTVNE